MFKHDPANGVFVDTGWQFSDLQSPAITPSEWLAMLRGVVAQLPAEQHEEFVTQILNALDHAGIELAGCVATEFEAARWWR